MSGQSYVSPTNITTSKIRQHLSVCLHLSDVHNKAMYFCLFVCFQIGRTSSTEEEEERKKDLKKERQLVTWYFEPTQPLRIIPGLKANFSPSPSDSAHRSSNQKFSKIYNTSSDTNLHKTKHTYNNIKHKIFEELVPSVSSHYHHLSLNTMVVGTLHMISQLVTSFQKHTRD